MKHFLPRTGELPEVLRFLLRERGLSQSELARATGVPRPTIGHWLRGRAAADLVAVRRVAHYLGVSFEQLIFGVEEGLSLQDLLLDRVFEGTVRLRVERIGRDGDTSHTDQTGGKSPKA